MVLLVLLIWNVASAESLTVLYATAGTTAGLKKSNLSTGDALPPTDEIHFTDRFGKLALWSQSEGLLLLTPKEQPDGKWKTSGTLAELKQPLPEVRTYEASFSNMEGLKQHFKDRRYLLLDRSWLLATPPFDLSGDTLLFIKYERPKANMQVSRKLEHHGDSLLLDPKFILDMNGVPVPMDDAEHFQLYWLDLKTRGYLELVRFEFVFVEEATLVSEVSNLLTQLKRSKMPRGDQAVILQQFLTAVHGTPDPHNFKLWMAQHFPEAP